MANIKFELVIITYYIIICKTSSVAACVIANNKDRCYNIMMQSPDIYTTLLDDLAANRNGSPEVLPLNAPVEQETGDLLVGVNPKEYGKRGVTFTINAGRISIAAADGERGT
jgi:hypothetical protein